MPPVADLDLPLATALTAATGQPRDLAAVALDVVRAFEKHEAKLARQIAKTVPSPTPPTPRVQSIADPSPARSIGRAHLKANAEANYRTSRRVGYRRIKAGIAWTIRDTLILAGGLVVMMATAAFYVQPAKPNANTTFRMQQAEFQVFSVPSDDPRDAAQLVAEQFMKGWDPETLFRGVHPDFWMQAGSPSANIVADRYVKAFAAIQAKHGRLISANAREGSMKLQQVKNIRGQENLGRMVTLNAEFSDGTVRHFVITLVRSVRRPADWAIWNLSMDPFLKP